jgi:hypothetical protein
MSGIILPGRQPKPDSQEGGSGLILPSSASRKREEPKPAAPAEPSEPGAPAGAARRGRPLSAEDLLFPPSGAQVQCPQCGTPYVVPVFSIIDTGANPELMQALLGGQINVGVCPNCGATGALSAPLLVHVPDKQFLGVVIPNEARVSDMQRQKMIGDLTQTLMRKLPQDARKGYMLQPREFLDWNRLIEQLWEFNGVTAEMLRRQRAQTDLLQSLLMLADDRPALEIAIGRSGDLIDQSFFSLLDRLMMMTAAQGPDDMAERFGMLRDALLEMTPAGKEVAAQQDRILAVLQTIKPETTREELLQILLDVRDQPDGLAISHAVLAGLPTLFDYAFLMALAARLDASTDEEERGALVDIRETVLAVQDRMQQSRQAAMQQTQQLLQEVLSAEDAEATLRANVDILDELFLSLLANSIDNAERNNSKGAARRLKSIYDLSLKILQEGLPPDMQFMNELLTAYESKADLTRLIQDNHDRLTPDFVEMLRRVESESRDMGRSELADRIKSIRSQISLAM